MDEGDQAEQDEQDVVVSTVAMIGWRAWRHLIPSWDHRMKSRLVRSSYRRRSRSMTVFR